MTTLQYEIDKNQKDLCSGGMSAIHQYISLVRIYRVSIETPDFKGNDSIIFEYKGTNLEIHKFISSLLKDGFYAAHPQGFTIIPPGQFTRILVDTEELSIIEKEI